MKSLILFVLGMCAAPPPARTACAQRCATLSGCADQVTLDRCVQDCTVDVAIGACMARLGCHEYRRRLAMDLDLVGTCEAEARYQRAIAPSRPAR